MDIIAIVQILVGLIFIALAVVNIPFTNIKYIEWRNTIVIVLVLGGMGLLYWQSKLSNDDRRNLDTTLSSVRVSFQQLNQEGQASANTLLDRYLHSEADNNRWENVLRLTNLMLAIDNTNQSALNFKGEYYRNFMSDAQSAIAWYKNSLGVNNNNKYAADAYVYLGNCYKKNQKIKEALESYKKALSIEPNYPKLRALVKNIEQGISREPK